MFEQDSTRVPAGHRSAEPSAQNRSAGSSAKNLPHALPGGFPAHSLTTQTVKANLSDIFATTPTRILGKHSIQSEKSDQSSRCTAP